MLQAGLRHETVVWPYVQHGMEAFPKAATTSGFVAVLPDSVLSVCSRCNSVRPAVCCMAPS